MNGALVTPTSIWLLRCTSWCACHCLYWNGWCSDCGFAWCCVITYPYPSYPPLAQYSRYYTLLLHPRRIPLLPEWTTYVRHSNWILNVISNCTSCINTCKVTGTMNYIFKSLESYNFGLCGNCRITTLAHSVLSIGHAGLFLVHMHHKGKGINQAMFGR